MTRTDPMHLGLFLKATGHHVAAWHHPGVDLTSLTNVDHFVECAQIAEKHALDFIFFADSLAVRQGDHANICRFSQFTAYLEPLTLLSAIAMKTSRIGLVATMSTSYNEPYHVARKFASLDHISGGRAGWNVVTSGNGAEAFNFGRDAHYGHAERYRRAHEFVAVVEGLWDSWEEDALIHDRATGRFFDPAKLHRLDHHGPFFKVRGPLNMIRPPQGRPVIFQAGTSEDGRQLAAATAEGLFTSELTLDRSQAYYADVKARAVRQGRAADQMIVLPGITITVGTTDAEARDKDEYLQSLIPEDVGRDYIADLMEMDLSDCSVKDRLPDRPSPRSEGGHFKAVVAMAREEDLSIEQLYRRLAGSFGKLAVVGSVNTIADLMEQWFTNHACDGFIIQPPVLPLDLVEICTSLVPELQRRGLVRTEYEGATLREHLGLHRPASRHQSTL